jgi:hypothetical protein
MACCHGCTKRTIWCHGKNEDGTWRCRDWGLEQAAREQEYQRRLEQNMTDAYFADFRKEKQKQEKAHKSYRGKG